VKVALSYRVLQHWRTPVFRRLAAWPGVDFLAFHGADFPGTKVVNGKDLSGFRHRQLATIRVGYTTHAREVAMPLCPGLPFALARFRPDVILAEGGSNMLNSFLVLAYAKATRTPVVWWTLGEVRYESLSLSQRAFRTVVPWMERRCNAVLGYSSLALAYFDRQGYPKERQFRAVNCVDTELVETRIEAVREEVEPLRRRLGLEGKRVLLYVGALAPYKRLDDAIAAYARLRPRHPDLRFVIVGDGPSRKELERFAASEGAEDVIFTGQVIEGVAAYFQIGDVFVLPGLGGLAISEAMVHGMPVIATEADGSELDLVEEGRNGHLLEVGDRDGLTERLDAMLSEPGRLEAMAAHSRWIIGHRHNIRTYMENVVASLEYAVGEGRRGTIGNPR
jgi:glycosyltransferase involved in cell wall biosynthesis